MSHPAPNITVNVDVTNPGQFFACCGLLELADRLWPGAEAWFDGSSFVLDTRGGVAAANDLLLALLALPEFQPSATKESVLQGSALKLRPFTITFPRNVLRIDWWRDEMRPADKASREQCAKSAFKTWAGNQSPPQIIYDRLLPALRHIMKAPESEWFHERVPLTGRFGFDRTAAIKSLDAGWSPDKLGVSVATSPAVELLAMIGLQRFRPVLHEAWGRYRYHLWRTPSTVVVAPARAAGTIAESSILSFTFGIEERGDYKFFGSATPIGVHQ